MDKDFAMTPPVKEEDLRLNKKGVRNHLEALNAIDHIGGLHGQVLDIGERNLFTAKLEELYDIKIHSTRGDLDLALNCPDFQYDFVIYNNVIEHQFNPLLTLLEIHKRLKDDGKLILGTPLKPTWITFARCHFHEFDNYRFNKIIQRGGFKITFVKKYYHIFSLRGIRMFFGSFHTRQVITVLDKL